MNSKMMCVVNGGIADLHNDLTLYVIDRSGKVTSKKKSNIH